MAAEASRAKHKFAVKRNSWPKTRGVAMNPVDHVSKPQLNLSLFSDYHTNVSPYSLTVVVITSISVKPRPSPATPHKVKRPVSSPPGELVCCVVPRRPRIREVEGEGEGEDGVWSVSHHAHAAASVVCVVEMAVARFFEIAQMGHLKRATCTLEIQNCCNSNS